MGYFELLTRCIAEFLNRISFLEADQLDIDVNYDSDDYIDDEERLNPEELKELEADASRHPHTSWNVWLERWIQPQPFKSEPQGRKGLLLSSN